MCKTFGIYRRIGSLQKQNDLLRYIAGQEPAAAVIAMDQGAKHVARLLGKPRHPRHGRYHPRDCLSPFHVGTAKNGLKRAFPLYFSRKNEKNQKKFSIAQ